MNDANPLSPKMTDGLRHQRSPNTLLLPLRMNHHIKQDTMLVTVTQQGAPGNECSLLIEASYCCPVSIPSVLFISLEGFPAYRSSQFGNGTRCHHRIECKRNAAHERCLLLPLLSGLKTGKVRIKPLCGVREPV